MIKLMFTGRLGKDAELRLTSSGTSVLGFTVASDAGWGDKAHTNWIDCSVWGKRADSLAPYLIKGLSVTIVGDADLREWEGKDGKTGKTLSCNVDSVEMHGGGNAPSGNGSADSGHPTKPEGFRKPPAPAADDFDQDDIPF
jgi:single-strand DNA-binding protein